jgi:hypothetical protein
MGVVIYTSIARPFIDDSDDYLDIFNEFSIMGLAYACVMFTDFLDDSEAKYEIGWACVFLFGVNLVVNIGFILVKTVISLVQMLRKKK